MKVAFVPKAAGTRTAVLRVGTAGTVSLTGTGVATADLRLAMTAPSSVQSGRTATYTLTVTNNGPASARAVLTDQLPAQALFRSIAVAGADCTTPVVGRAGTIRCTTQTLPRGWSMQVKVTVTVLGPVPGGWLTGRADVAALDATDPSPGNNTVSVRSRAR